MARQCCICDKKVGFLETKIIIENSRCVCRNCLLKAKLYKASYSFEEIKRFMFLTKDELMKLIDNNTQNYVDSYLGFYYKKNKERYCSYCNAKLGITDKYCYQCGNPLLIEIKISKENTMNFNNEDGLLDLIEQGKKVEAIKYIRETSTLSLKDAKELVDKIEIEQEKSLGYEKVRKDSFLTYRTDATIEISNIDGMDGHEFEYYCADVLRKNRFKNVKVTPASGDQGVDILAEKDGVKYAIQCKNYATPLGNTPIQEVNAGKIFYGCHVGVVLTNSTFTSGGIRLAEKTGVLLWDRKKLIELLKVCETNSKPALPKETEIKVLCETAKENNQYNEVFDDSTKLVFVEENIVEKNVMKNKEMVHERKVNVYDKGKGRYPAGQYRVGQDLPLGSYLLTARKGNIASIELFTSYKKFKDAESILYTSFDDDYHIALLEENMFVVIEEADLKKL